MPCSARNARYIDRSRPHRRHRAADPPLHPAHAGHHHRRRGFQSRAQAIGAQARIPPAHRLVQTAWRLHQFADPRGACRRGRRSVGRQSRRGGRLRGDAARHPGDDFRAESCLARQARPHSLLRRRTGGDWRGLCRGAGGERRADRQDRRFAGPRLRPAGDAARPRLGWARAGSRPAGHRHAAGRDRRRRARRRHRRLVRRQDTSSCRSSRKPRRRCTTR